MFAASLLLPKEPDGRFGVTELRVGVYKCPGLPHQWCKILEQRQANPLSHCAVCVSVCMCVHMRKKKENQTKKDTEAERETGLGYGQLLRVCTVLSWALGGQLYSSPSLPLHYSGSGHTLFSSASLSPLGPIDPLTNTLTYLNSHIDPLKYWSIICLDPLRFQLVCTLSK